MSRLKLCIEIERIVICHAGTRYGFTQNSLLLCGKLFSTASADYHMDINEGVFKSWLQNKLLPNLPPKCVLILDNANYHSRVEKKISYSGNEKK